MEKHFFKNIPVFCMLLLLLSSCFSVKPGTSRSARNLYQNFFIGEEGSQYFIKPIAFENDEKEKLQLDITFRYKDEVKDSATVNFSIVTKELNKTISIFSIGNSQNLISTNQINHLFSERDGNFFKSRFSARFPLAEIQSLFENNAWNINEAVPSKNYQFTATKSAKKAIEALNFEVFVLF